MPRSPIGFIARFSSLTAASVATLAIASASPQGVEGPHQATMRPATEEVMVPGGATGVSRESDSSFAYPHDRSLIARVDTDRGGIGLLTARDIGSGEQFAILSAPSRQDPEEARSVDFNHPVRLTSILATLALIAFYFLRRFT